MRPTVYYLQRSRSLPCDHPRYNCTLGQRRRPRVPLSGTTWCWLGQRWLLCTFMTASLSRDRLSGCGRQVATRRSAPYNKSECIGGHLRARVMSYWTHRKCALCLQKTRVVFAKTHRGTKSGWSANTTQLCRTSERIRWRQRKKKLFWRSESCFDFYL